jgi:hypothetical protein
MYFVGCPSPHYRWKNSLNVKPWDLGLVWFGQTYRDAGYGTDGFDDSHILIAFLPTWQWNVSPFYPHIAPMAMRDQRKHSVDSLSDFFDQRFWMTLERTTKFAWTCTFCILWFLLGLVWRSECTLTNIEPRARPATSLFTALRHDDRGPNSGMGHGGDRSHTVVCRENGVYHGVRVHPI